MNAIASKVKQVETLDRASRISIEDFCMPIFHESPFLQLLRGTSALAEGGSHQRVRTDAPRGELLRNQCPSASLKFWTKLGGSGYVFCNSANCSASQRTPGTQRTAANNWRASERASQPGSDQTGRKEPQAFCTLHNRDWCSLAIVGPLNSTTLLSLVIPSA